MSTVKPYIGPERRGFVRVPVYAEAVASAPRELDAYPLLEDVSRVGFRFGNAEDLQVGNEVTVRVENRFQDGAPICVEMLIVWQREFDGDVKAGAVLSHGDHESVPAVSEVFYHAISGHSATAKALPCGT